MTQLAHPTESRFPPMEKVFHTTKADTTGRHPMKKFRGSTTIRCLVLGLLVLAVTSCSQKQPPSLAEEIAVYMDPDRPLALNLPEYPVYTSHRYLEWKAYRCIYDNPDIILSSCLKDRI